MDSQPPFIAVLMVIKRFFIFLSHVTKELVTVSFVTENKPMNANGASMFNHCIPPEEALL
jgi:hypothetical protein